MTGCGLLPLQTSAQQALMGTINTSMHAVQQAQDDLSELDSLPPLGQDMVSIYGCHSVSLPGTKQGFSFCRYSAGWVFVQIGEVETHGLFVYLFVFDILGLHSEAVPTGGCYWVLAVPLKDQELGLWSHMIWVQIPVPLLASV